MGAALAQAPLPDTSPFIANNAAAKAAPDEPIELAGVSTVGDRTDLIFHNKTSKKNTWVRVGATADGITALKYDPHLERAVVRIDGVEKVLTLRTGTGPVNAPMPPPVAAIPPVPPPANAAPGTPGLSPTGAATAPATPDAVAKQENEARMLVSDLLEIGMAQRKAYEEAQRKAAQANGGSPATPPPAPGTAQPAPASVPPAVPTAVQPMPNTAPPAAPPAPEPPAPAPQN
jgi:hypothetical protein